MVFAVWLGVTYANTCFVKWSWNTKTLLTLGDWFGSKVASMLVKSTCRRSRGAVATMGCRGALGRLSSCCRHHVQFLIGCHIWLAIPGHQKHSCSKDKVAVMVLMSCILVTTIESSDLMCLWDHEEH